MIVEEDRREEYQDDDEVLNMFFDFDRASAPAPESDITHTPDSTYLDQYFGDPEVDFIQEIDMIPEPIPTKDPLEDYRSREKKRKLSRKKKRENFSGGIGCYVWPWSPDVFMGLDEPRIEMGFKFIGRKKRTLQRNEELIVPSKFAGINWGEEILWVYGQR
ncbi:hypothetical protein M426DRAFT_13370 [Hypoxylon sp. CI-4A]|nr:hypothetical protein M426DRAFT_13370 [Hypoxylon sp. CI-4A]